MSSVASVSSLIAAPDVAELLPVGHLGDDGGALAPDRAVARRMFARSSRIRERGSRRLREGLGRASRAASPLTTRGSPRDGPGERPSRDGEGRRRSASGRSCRSAQTASAPEASISAILSSSMAVDTSAFFTANVPPKPQHSSASGRSTSSTPPTARSRRNGASPTREQPQGVAGRVIGDRARVGRADVVDPERSEELRELPRARAATPAPSPRATRGVLSHLRGARAGRRHDGVIGREDLDEAPCEPGASPG